MMRDTLEALGGVFVGWGDAHWTVGNVLTVAGFVVMVGVFFWREWRVHAREIRVEERRVALAETEEVKQDAALRLASEQRDAEERVGLAGLEAAFRAELRQINGTLGRIETRMATLEDRQREHELTCERWKGTHESEIVAVKAIVASIDGQLRLAALDLHDRVIEVPASRVGRPRAAR